MDLFILGSWPEFVYEQQYAATKFYYPVFSFDRVSIKLSNRTIIMFNFYKI